MAFDEPIRHEGSLALMGVRFHVLRSHDERVYRLRYCESTHAAYDACVTNTMMSCGFTRVVKRDGASVLPLATLLFFGYSSKDERQLEGHLERSIRLTTMCTFRLLVFGLDKLRSRRTTPGSAFDSQFASSYLN